MLWLDANATTRPSTAVVEAVSRALVDHWENPSSVHRAGQGARRLVELARRALADLVNAKPRELILTSSGTESCDLALRGVLHAALARSGHSRRALITTRVEHAAVRECAEDLQKQGVDVRWAPVMPGGVVDIDALATMLDEHVALVSVQWANNETGAIQPVNAIGALCRARGALYHCDAVQWVGKAPTDLARDGPFDLLSFSPHKFHGPKGVGVLWVRPGTPLRPTVAGAQELGRRGGTENVPGIAGAGVAAREAREWLLGDSSGDSIEDSGHDSSEDAGNESGASVGASLWREHQRLAALRDDFEQRIRALIPDAVVNRPGHDADRLWNTSNIAFPRLEAEALLMLLSERGVYASAGAACSSGSLEPSPVLLAMGVPPALAHGALRFSFDRHVRAEELERAASIVVECVAQVRRSMPGSRAG